MMKLPGHAPRFVVCIPYGVAPKEHLGPTHFPGIVVVGIQEAEEVSEFWVYSTQERCEDQVSGLWEVTLRRMVYSSWFNLSVRPLFWAWKPEPKLTLAPIEVQKVFQVWEVKGPQSEIIFSQIPWSLKILWTRLAVFTGQFRNAWKPASIATGIPCTHPIPRRKHQVREKLGHGKWAHQERLRENWAAG